MENLPGNLRAKVMAGLEWCELRKKIVEEFFLCFETADAHGASRLLHDNVHWHAMGGEGGLPMSGTMDKEAIGELILYVKEQMPDGLALTPTGWTVQDNRVAVEVHSYGVKKNGLIYDNHYHFLFLVNSGKIREIREYMDTLHAKRVFVDDALLS